MFGAAGAAGFEEAKVRAAAATPKVLGTVQATVDGTVRTWYVVSGTSGGRPYASGLWQEVMPGRRLIILGGYDTQTPPLETFEWEKGMPRSYGSYTGSTIGLVLNVGATPAPYRARLPHAGTQSDSVLFAHVATLDVRATFMMKQGQIDVTAVSIAGGLASATGTFAGTLARMMSEDATVTVTNGRFEVSGMPDLATIAPHWSKPR
jgi:hypothetical protein